jgi:endogenous inhibitor of DNA gyrase (YacG/DUF329 family)
MAKKYFLPKSIRESEGIQKEFNEKRRIAELLKKYSEELPQKQSFSTNNGITNICNECGKEFITYRYPSRFCSKECVSKWLSENPKTCIKCGKQFIVKGLTSYGTQKFCSKECARNLKPKICDGCGLPLTVFEEVRSGFHSISCYQKYLEKLKCQNHKTEHN